MNRIQTGIAAALVVSFVGIQPLPAAAKGKDRRDATTDETTAVIGRDVWDATIESIAVRTTGTTAAAMMERRA